MNIIGKKAPVFYAEGTKGQVYFPIDNQGKWNVLYFYPGDFTPESASDIMALDSKIPKFKSYNSEVIAISPDSVPSHIAWVLSLQNMNKQGKPIDFALLSDRSLEISKAYGILNTDTNNERNEKAVIITDPEGIVRSFHKYSNNMGLNITEIERELLALQIVSDKKVISPAGWTPGEDLLIYPPKTVEDAKTNISEREKEGNYCLDWYICYKMQ